MIRQSGCEALNQIGRDVINRRMHRVDGIRMNLGSFERGLELLGLDCQIDLEQRIAVDLIVATLSNENSGKIRRRDEWHVHKSLSSLSIPP